MVLAAGETGGLRHFRVHSDRLGTAADYVAAEIRRNYPDLTIPFHSRWRHFVAGGVDRWQRLAAGLADVSPDELARIRFDLAVISVLLDAGAGARWRWRDPDTGDEFRRSEGLALASLALFASGALSADPARPLRADAAALERLDDAALGDAFQVAPDNPLAGLAGRAALLRGAGRALHAAPDLFGRERPRVGNLFDHLRALAAGGGLPAPAVLDAVLRGLGPIWPGRIRLAGVELGDTWRHPAARAPDLTDGLVPFHKLSQWLAYSLVEPIEDAGIRVVELDALTGLAEYRNGGLFLDLGVLELADPAAAERDHAVDSELVVEWRALTVALLDRLAPLLRERLGLPDLPLARILQGGTWSAGRRIARERRADGAPPLRVLSDGTVF